MAIVTAKRAVASAGIDVTALDAAMDLSAKGKSEAKHGPTQFAVAVGALAVVFVGLAIVVWTVNDPSFDQGDAAATPVQGLTIFATFFVAAAAIERLLEPLSKLLPSATDMHADADTKLSDAGMKFAAGHSDAEDALNTAATLSDHASYRDYWKSISLWTVATLLAMVAAAFLRLYFLRTVGISNGPRPMEILATGLIIGSGTKPLHDLVTYISAAADAKTS